MYIELDLDLVRVLEHQQLRRTSNVIDLNLENENIFSFSNSVPIDRFRSPMRVNHQPVLSTNPMHRSPLSPSATVQSPIFKGPSSPTKKSLKDLRNDPLPTLPRLPPRKT